jgi:hypothetical protein
MGESGNTSNANPHQEKCLASRHRAFSAMEHGEMNGRVREHLQRKLAREEYSRQHAQSFFGNELRRETWEPADMGA